MVRDASVKTQDIKLPFKMEGGARVDDTSVPQALRERWLTVWSMLIIVVAEGSNKNRTYKLKAI